MTAQNHTLPADDSRREAYSRLLTALQSMPDDKPLYVTLQTAKPASCVIQKGQQVGQFAIGKGLTLSSAAEFDVVVTIRRK